MPVCPYLIKNVGHYWFEFRQCSKAGFNLVGIGVTILFAQCHPYSCADSGIFVRGGGGGVQVNLTKIALTTFFLLAALSPQAFVSE